MVNAVAESEQRVPFIVSGANGKASAILDFVVGSAE
jgi:hypothetical protein